MNDALTLVGRVLLGLLFLGGAVQKAIDPAPAMALLQGWSLPAFLVWPALIFNAVAALSLFTGIALRPVAAALAAYCMVTAFFHLIPSDPWQMTIFVKNFAIAGGLLVLTAHGAGRFTLR